MVTLNLMENAKLVLIHVHHVKIQLTPVPNAKKNSFYTTINALKIVLQIMLVSMEIVFNASHHVMSVQIRIKNIVNHA